MGLLFSDYQVARFNEIYYQKRASDFRLWIKLANVVAALAASTVFVNLIKDNGPLFGLGPSAWKAMTALAAISAAISPVLGLEDKAARFEKCVMGYGIVRERLKALLRDLKLSEMENSHVARQSEIEHLSAALSALDDSTSENIKKKSWEQTLQELPSDQAWTLI